MPADEPPPATDDGLVGRYEALRRHALDGDGQGWRLGLALLCHRGVAAWMRAWDGLPAASAAAAGGSPTPPASADQPLVGVLASMALACVAGR